MSGLHISLQAAPILNNREIPDSNEDDEDQDFGSTAWTASRHLCSTKYNRYTTTYNYLN